MEAFGNRRPRKPRTYSELPALPMETAKVLTHGRNFTISNDEKFTEELTTHANELRAYARQLRVEVRSHISSKDNEGLGSSLERECHSAYFHTGLRRRICELLEVASIAYMYMQPPEAVLALLHDLDYPHREKPSGWWTAAYLCARENVAGRTPTAGWLARRVQARPSTQSEQGRPVPVSTMRGWMQSAEWKITVEEERASFPKAIVRRPARPRPRRET